VQRNFTARDFSAARNGVSGSPWITGLMPDTVGTGDPDMAVTVSGGGFTEESVIVWDGVDVPTTRINKTRLTFTVEPTAAHEPGTVSVTVRNGELTAAETIDFTFTDPVMPEGTSEEILVWVNNDANRATIALEAEEADPEPRSELVSQLEAIINAEPSTDKGADHGSGTE
jgi:hypothetical protein